jgi:hypothetical protein
MEPENLGSFEPVYLQRQEAQAKQGVQVKQGAQVSKSPYSAGADQHSAGAGQIQSRTWTIAVGLILSPGVTIAVPFVVAAKIGSYGLYKGYKLTRHAVKKLILTPKAKIKEAEPKKTRKQHQKEVAWKALVKDVKIACLMLIPAGGIFLASTYAKYGHVSIQKAMQDPSIAALTLSLTKVFATGPEKFIYNDAVRKLNYTTAARRDNKEELRQAKEKYFKNKSGTFSFETVDKQALTCAYEYKSVKTQNGRAHEIVHIFANGNDSNQVPPPTVVLYHGRGGCKEGVMDRAERYLQDGYDVVLSSYAGDGACFFEDCEPVDCTEEEMLYDAQADMAYLASTGVQEVVIHGYSLGGAHGANCMQFLAHKNVSNSYEEKSITYAGRTFNSPHCKRMIFERTFTSAEVVAGNAVHNAVFDTLKTSSIFLKNLIVDGVSAGYEQERMRHAVEEVCGVKPDRLNTLKKLQDLAARNIVVDCTFIAAEKDEVTGDVQQSLCTSIDSASDCDMTLHLANAVHANSKTLTYYIPKATHITPVNWKDKKFTLIGST